MEDPKPVVVLDLNGNYIGDYKNPYYASKKLLLTYQHVLNTLKGHSLRCEQYFFVYKDYYDPTKNYSYKARKNKRKLLKLLKHEK